MKHTEDLDKIVALILCSAYRKGDKPLSLLMVSDRPESGKTEIVKKFIGTPKVEFATDASGYGILRDFSDKVLNDEVRTIIIPELLKPLMKGKATASSFTSTLQEMMEDGVMGMHSGFLTAQYSSKMDKAQIGRTVGFIGCMPRQMFVELKPEWNLTGFLSRWLVVSYKYGDVAIDSILDSVVSGEYLNTDKIKDTSMLERLSAEWETEVIIPVAVGNKCRELSTNITKTAVADGSLYGFRELKHVLSLVAANVIYDRVVNGSTRAEATITDYNEIERLSYLFNEQFNEVKTDKEGDK